jgi:hypothetical protein
MDANPVINIRTCFVEKVIATVKSYDKLKVFYIWLCDRMIERPLCIAWINVMGQICDQILNQCKEIYSRKKWDKALFRVSRS